MGDTALGEVYTEKLGGELRAETSQSNLSPQTPQELTHKGGRLEPLAFYKAVIKARMRDEAISPLSTQLPGSKSPMWYTPIRRIADIAISIAGLILLCPLLPIVAIAIKINSRGSLFYKQERVGLHGRVFTMWKLRTMICDAEEGVGAVWAEANDNRITAVGKVLRKSRFDELPQLFSVLKGEMSFIGPRPERPYFVGQLMDQIPGYVERLEVKPGITGWAQVNLNYDRNIDDVKVKLDHDLYYIENGSVLLDFIILLRTVITVLTCKGAH